METEMTGLLENAMSAYAQRRRVVSSNIANADTPGYDRRSVSFEKELREARSGGLSLEAPSEVEPQVETGEKKPTLEQQLMKMSDTQMRTRLASRALSEHFGLIETGITGQSG